MKSLDSIKGNTSALVMLERAVDILKEIGFIEFLTDKARPVLYKQGSDIHINSAQAARSAGYFECIADLTNFKEIYLTEAKVPMAGMEPDYGGNELAVQKGYMTKKEADGLIRG